jgi:acyl-CoA dehydrogenase
MNRLLLNKVKSIIPRITDTELIALRSGTVSIDREIFEGKVTTPKRLDISSLHKPELETSVKTVLSKFGGQEVIYPSHNYKQVLKVIGNNKLFSLIISDEYGGNPVSTTQLSSLLTKISSVNPALGVTVMVPNSLGPAELLYNYGTEQQKQQFLPRLASGELIPCFGLTGPDNGSDAVGSIDTGIVVEEEGSLFIKINLNKRYITLAPVANLAGIAFRLEDPDGRLSNGKSGITVALVERGTCGLIQDTFHNPLNVGFPNGTLKGNVKIPIDQVIGGVDNVGEGWKMLMECLAAGRGVCLPATANACSKVSTFGIWYYINHRRQFNIPLVDMEAVSNKFCDMLYHTWTIQAGVSMTNNLLDKGERPAVISAIMKQQTTDRAREVLNHGMDIHAGSAICTGDNNFLEKFYKSAPIGITVEGSNTLTRNLIIFGQGLNKSHPHIYEIYNSIQDDDVSKFRSHFWTMVRNSTNNYVSSVFNIKPIYNGIAFSDHKYFDNYVNCQTVAFSALANFVAMMGGKIKKNQTISALMADVLSNLYLAQSLIYFRDEMGKNKEITSYCLYRLLYENNITINEIIRNYPTKRIFFQIMLNQLGAPITEYNYKNNRDIIDVISQNEEEIMNTIKEDIILDGALQNLESLTRLKKAGEVEKYNLLYNKTISVGEYSNALFK